mgnify:CR=1 FL=1
MTNRLVTLIQQRQATIAKLKDELADAIKARILVGGWDGPEPEWPALAALWERTEAASNGQNEEGDE